MGYQPEISADPLFYEAWDMLDSSLHKSDNSVIAITELENLSQSVITITETEQIDIYHAMAIPNTADFPAMEFLTVPFTHHTRIISKVKELQERYYYIRRCAQEHLSVETLVKLIDNNAFASQQHLSNNFSKTMLDAKEARRAVMMFKDEYALDFINVEEIGERESEDIDERLVEQQIVQNIKRFIMTFGRDFTFIGNQYHLEVYGVEHFPDLLFFNRELNAMVCMELKTGSFKPGYLGQLMAYLCIWWTTKPEYFANADKFNQTLAVIEKELASSKEDYIEKFRHNYVESYPPAWMITEVLSFGNLNYIYSNIASNKLMKRIAGYFGLKPQVFTSWLTVLANFRNMCCHHARVWNRDFMLNPAEPRKMSNTWIDTSKIDKKRIFYRLCIIRYFLVSISPNNNFNEKVANLLACFPSIDITAMGFYKGWTDEHLWR